LRFQREVQFERVICAMSAIGYSRRGNAYKGRAILIGAHADFRPQDFRFPRTQSRLLSETKWESRIRPLHSWAEIALYAAGIAVLVIATLSMVA
jgi:hypothetical protein